MTQELQWIDTHCHVYEENIPGGQEHALQAARDAGVVTMIVIGTDADTTRQAIDIVALNIPTCKSVLLIKRNIFKI